MSTHDRSIDLDQLLGHAEWVRRLARSILADAGMADDVVQETWLKVLERPPRDHDRLAHWFRKVGRNLALSRRRQIFRSAARERSAARSEVSGTPNGGSIVERAESHRLVVDVVLALDEPYRTCVLLRWFDGLEPDEIAKKLHAPASTIRVRLMRALEMIRGRLDVKDREERTDWKKSLVLLAGLGRAPVPSAVGKSAGVIKKLQAAAAAVILATVVVIGSSDAAIDDALPRIEGPPLTEAPPDLPRRANETAHAIFAVEIPKLEPVSAPPGQWSTMVTCAPYAPMVGLDRVHFVVRDADRRPISGAAVSVDGVPFALSALDGSVALAGLEARSPSPTSRVTINRSDYATFDQALVDLAGRFLAQRSGELDVTLPDPGDLVVHATDQARTPLSNIEIRVVVGGRTIATARTDEKGEAHFTSLPVTVEGATIECADVRFAAATLPVTLVRRTVVRYPIVLAPGRRFMARIVDSKGAPRIGTIVRAAAANTGQPLPLADGRREALTDARGEVAIFGHVDGPVRLFLRPDASFLETQFTFETTPESTSLDCVLPSTLVRLRFQFPDGAHRPIRVAATPRESETRIVGESVDGTAALCGLPEGESIYLRFTVPGAVDIDRTIDPLTAEQPIELTIDMPNVAAVGVALTGTPNAVTRYGLVWSKLDADGTRTERRTVRFDPDGYARCDLAPGDYEYVVFEEGGSAKGPVKKTIECTTKFAIDYKADRSMRGLLTDQLGSPLAGWTIGAFGPAGDLGTFLTTDERGLFELRDSRFDEVALFGRGPGFREPVRLAISASTSEEIKLSLSVARVVIRVTDFESGQPARRSVRLRRIPDEFGDPGIPGRFVDAFRDPTFGLSSDESGLLEIDLPHGNWSASVGDEQQEIPRGSAIFEVPGTAAPIDLLVASYSRVELAAPETPEEPIRLKWSRTVADRTICGEVTITGSAQVFH